MSTQLPETAKVLLRRIAAAAGRPMSQVLPAIIEVYAQTLNPTTICNRCRDLKSPVRFKDQSPCDLCPFNTRAVDEEAAAILEPLNYHFEREVTHMKPTQVSVLISKKIGKSFCSWSVSHGVTAELEDHDHFKEALIALDGELKAMVSQSLPSDLKSATAPRQLPAELPPIPEAASTTG